MKQSQFYYLLRRGLFSAGSAIIKNGLVMFNKFTTAGLNFPAQGSAEFNGSSDYIQLNDPFSHTNHTISAWVYVNDNAANKEVFDNRNAELDPVPLVPLGPLRDPLLPSGRFWIRPPSVGGRRGGPPRGEHTGWAQGKTSGRQYGRGSTHVPRSQVAFITTA